MSKFSFMPILAIAAPLLLLGACTTAYENGALSRFINHQEQARDSCLMRSVGAHDDGAAAESVGRAIAARCAPENDRLIQAMAAADPSGRQQIADAVRRDAVVKATGYVLQARAYAAAAPGAAQQAKVQ